MELPTSNKICTSDGKTCFDKQDFSRMMREAKPYSHSKKEFNAMVYLSIIFQKYVMLFGIVLLLSFALFTYGNDVWMIARFMAFAAVCVLLINVFTITAPVALLFSSIIYNWLLSTAGLESSLLTITVYSLTLILGTFGFLILIMKSGFIQGWFASKVHNELKK